MKKTIVFLLLLAGTVVSCSKEDKKPKYKRPLTDYIQRTWYTLDDKNTYYDQMNTAVYEETSEPNVTYRLNNGEVKFTDANKKNTQGSYILSQSNGKDMITIMLNDKAEAYEIVSIDDSLMTWRQEKTNVTYTENGVEKTAAKQIHTLNLHCPCQPH